MTDESNIESAGKIKAERLSALAKDAKNGLAEIHVTQDHLKMHSATRLCKAAKTKRELMEELSRERFPWEE